MGGIGDVGGMVEKGSDAGIERAGDAVDQKTGGKGAEQIDQGQRAADEKIGG